MGYIYNPVTGKYNEFCKKPLRMPYFTSILSKKIGSVTMFDVIIRDSAHAIAFQGVPGAHSDMACQRAHPYLQTVPCRSFEDVFDAVQSEKVAYGMIPIENSHAGRVAEIHNLLPDSKLHIVGEYFHTVRHHLLAPKGASLETVKQTYSHAQALMQCAKSCRDLGLSQVPYSDTAAAARDVAKWEDVSKSALASDLAAELYGLEVLQRDMQDADDNVTLFVTLSKEPINPDVNEGNVILTSMLFTSRNIPAGLYKALGGFATNNVNLVKLESYIPDYRSGEAQFFITFEGHPDNKKVQLALEELGFFSKSVQLLGVYPADPKRLKTR